MYNKSSRLLTRIPHKNLNELSPFETTLPYATQLDVLLEMGNHKKGKHNQTQLTVFRMARKKRES